MAKKRDSQRQRLYDAECVPQSPEFKTIEECAAYASQVCRAARKDILRLFPELEGRLTRTVGIKDGRMRRSACFDPNHWCLRLPRWSRSRQVICHEIAHAYNRLLPHRPAAHSREFAGIYLILVKHGMSETDAKELKERFLNGRVDFKC